MARKIKLCKEPRCSNQQTTLGFCRLHYLKNWKKIRTDKKRKAAKNLNRYIDSIMRSEPDKGVKKLKGNLATDDAFGRSLEEVFNQDSLRDVMTDLGYREDLDGLIDSIKIDDNF